MRVHRFLNGTSTKPPTTKRNTVFRSNKLQRCSLMSTVQNYMLRIPMTFMDEDRWITTASHPADRQLVLRVVWTMRGGELGQPITRIISARMATKREQIDYEKQIKTRQGKASFGD